MLKAKILRATSVAVTSVGLVAGLSGIAGASSATASLNNTGPHSLNTINNTLSSRVRVNNDNHVSLHNYTTQQAYTGDATVHGNTNGGNATSGAANNTNSTSATVRLNNNTPLSTLGGTGGTTTTGSINNTGPYSTNTIDNTVRNKTSVSNDNNIYLRNSTDQTAVSGNANVSGNTNGGNATSGNASNSNSSSFTVEVNNNL